MVNELGCLPMSNGEGGGGWARRKWVGGGEVARTEKAVILFAMFLTLPERRHLSFLLSFLA